MKIKKQISLVAMILMVASVVTISACKKDEVKGCNDPNSMSYNPDAEENDGSCEYAGLGGQTTIVAFPKHHGNDTRPYHVYVKFNAQEFPGTNPSAYDLDIVADTTENHIEIENLKPGYYYIYMTAFDTAINAPVVGGIPYLLMQSSGEVDLDVPVTE